jgi:hypothetical protein
MLYFLLKSKPMRRASLVLLENFERLLTIFYNLLIFLKNKLHILIIIVMARLPPVDSRTLAEAKLLLAIY